jgi:hypothetical protein
MKGFSTEIVRKGMSLLIQTQFMEGQTGYIETLVYCQGRLLHSRKTSYPRRSPTPAGEIKMNARMAEEHEAVVKDLTAGRLDHLLS